VDDRRAELGRERLGKGRLAGAAAAVDRDDAGRDACRRPRRADGVG
jgi:hypothetical protein